jgi:hypothetical protein
MSESPFAKKPTPPAPTPQPSIKPEPSAADEIAVTRAVAEIQAAAGVKIWANFLFGFYGAVFGLPLLGLLLLWMIFTFTPAAWLAVILVVLVGGLAYLYVNPFMAWLREWLKH